MPELPEVEVTARLLDEALRGETIESAMAPGINALKTFDPPLVLEGATIDAVRRRQALLVDVTAGERGRLTVLIHLMSAGRLQLSTSGRRCATGVPAAAAAGPDPAHPDREPRLREFGTRQSARVKVLSPEAFEAEELLATLGPEAWLTAGGGAARRAAGRAAAAAPAVARPAGDRRSTHVVDDILHAAKPSPFKRGDDLSEPELAALHDAIAGSSAEPSSTTRPTGSSRSPTSRRRSRGSTATRASRARAARR